MCRCRKLVSWWTGNFWSKSVSLTLALHTSRFFWGGFCDDFCFLKFYLVLGCLLTSLICIMGELAGGGSVAVAVGVSDKLQITRNMTLFFYFSPAGVSLCVSKSSNEANVASHWSQAKSLSFVWVRLCLFRLPD